MMFYQWLFIAIGLLCMTHAIQVKPGPVYGPPTVQKHRLPHREYGVPQKIPFREYGPPALKYGPPKFVKNFGSNNVAVSSGFHEQIKTHFGVPKPFYGPPVSYKPATIYGPPIRQPSIQYGVPALKIQHKPASQYGPPKLHHSSVPPQSLPLIQPATLFKPEHQPSSSYGPPPSGPIPQGPKQTYGPPADNYGPPQLPNFNHGPETTLLVTTGDNHHQHHQQQQHQHQHQQQQQLYHHHHQQQQQQHNQNSAQQLHIQIDTHGHTHNGGGPQTPFHTACEGWKPIPGPSTGPFTEHNSVHTQSGYSHVSQGGHTGHVETFRIESDGHGSDLTNEQLIAVALQSGSFDGNDNTLHADIQVPPHSGPGVQFNQHHQLHQKFNGGNDLHSSFGPIDDTYSKPPSDSYAPGSIHALKHHAQSPPQPPNLQYELPLPADHSAANFVHHHAQHGLGIQYGKQSGNLQSYPQVASLPPTKPVAFRPPVPQGLLENIGATVKHVDTFGQKPLAQASTYIPPAASEIAVSSTSNLNPQYGPPLDTIEQQLPRVTSSNFIYDSHQHHQQQQQQQQQYQHANNIHDVYGVPSQTLPQNNYLPPLSGPSAPSNEYIPPLSHTSDHTLNQPNQQNGITYTAKAVATFENAYGASEHNHQTLPLQQHQHQQQQNTGYQGSDCGQGPILLNDISSNSVSQSIPIAEHHSQFYTEPTNSYGPPPSGNVDNLGFASENSGHSALPVHNYQDLEDFNIISGQIPSDNAANADYRNQLAPSYQLEISKTPKQTINHEEILSHDLLQSILSTIEQQPQLQPQTKYLPANHKAENRLDRNNQVEGKNHFDLDNETANSETVATIVKSTQNEENKEEQKLLKAIIVNDDEDAQDQDNAKH